MAVFPGSYIAIQQITSTSVTAPTTSTGIARLNYIIDSLLTPRLLAFRQVTVYDEPAVLMPDKMTWKVTYGGWNQAFPIVVHKNKAVIPNFQVSNIDYILGSYQYGGVLSGDNSNCTYNIDYFGAATLEGLVRQAIDIINTSAVGPPTNYTVDDAPQYWDGVIADIAFAMCMEKLLLEYDLWHGRLIFALSAQALEDGGGDITGALETLKTNSEERANKTLENEKFKVPPTLAPPTQFYYQAIRGFGRSGAHNMTTYGKLRGWKPTKYL